MYYLVITCVHISFAILNFVYLIFMWMLITNFTKQQVLNWLPQNVVITLLNSYRLSVNSNFRLLISVTVLFVLFMFVYTHKYVV